MPAAVASNLPERSAEDLLQVVETLLAEVRPGRTAARPIGLDTHFEKDLGLDSLTRVELIGRVERHFQTALPQRLYAEAETARDLLRAVLSSSAPRAAIAADTAPSLPGRVETSPDQAGTLLEVLDWHVRHHPERRHLQLFSDQGEGDSLSYAQLHQGAQQVAAGLQSAGIQAAEPVAIMLPSGTDYFFSFFGILLAGGIPVPVYPPARPAQLEDHLLRHARILANCRAVTLITVTEARQVARLLKSHVPGLKHIVTVAELTAGAAAPLPVAVGANDIAFIQYTSGSTGNPKGVALTHDNLLANIRAMGTTVQANSRDVFVSWLPLYHDMGLIGAWLGSLYYAMFFVVMPPLSFLARPERWLWAMHRYRGTLSASPNFGYEYCLKRLHDADLAGLDLSHWRAAFNGAEAISPDTLEAFIARFAAYGFDSGAMMPVYGLAESSVGLAFPPLERGPLIDVIDRDTFTQHGQARPVAAGDPHALRFVSSGSPLPGHQVRVVDAAGHELPERQEGRLEFRGPSSTSGYYRDTDNTRRLFHGDWLDSGDLAYIANGDIYITGRIKDIIIRAGRNIYPHELEQAVGELDGIRTGRVAVFGSVDRDSATERLVVLAETRIQDAEQREQLRTRINTLAADLSGAPPDEIVLAPPGTVLKTSSGKIRRSASRALYEKGEIGKRARSLPTQVLRLAASGVVPQLRRAANAVAVSAYALYAWCLFILLAPLAWLAVSLLPGYPLRWRVAQRLARLLASATATPLRVNGSENLPDGDGNYVLVANHASYLDAFALTAALPARFGFVAKSELAKPFIVRRPLENLRTRFVERFDIGKSVRDSRRLCAALKAGQPLLFFAEGTFTRVPGLMPFHLGAFSVAAEADVAVIPVCIRGTRSMLRADDWLPRRGAIQIDIGEPVTPADVGADREQPAWDTALALRDRCRTFILRHCGEPDLS